MSDSHAPVDGEIVVRALNSSVSIFSAPFYRGAGMEIGIRMTAFKLSSGDLVLYNAIHYEEAVRAALATLGTVKYIIVPNILHHGFIVPYNTAYPGVTWIMPEGVAAKHPDIQVKYELKAADDVLKITELNNEVHLAYFPDFQNKEILAFHQSTGVITTADMLWNLPAVEQYTQVHDKSRVPSHSQTDHKGVGVMQSIADGGMHPSAHLHHFMQWSLSKNTEAFQKWANTVVNTWQPHTIVPAHGDVITTGACDALKERFAAALPKQH